MLYFTLMKSVLTFLFSLVIPAALLAQHGQITITFLGNCGLHMTDGKLNVYTDFPYRSGAYNYMRYSPAEIDTIKHNAIFLFTHRHADHYCKPLVKKLDGKVFTPRNDRDLKKLNASSQDFSVQAFRTKHRFSLKHDSYLITWHGKRIYISGDTESCDTIAKQHGIDWAFVPSWILTDAQEKKIKIDAKKFALYHLYPLQKVDNETPDRIMLMDMEGKQITINY